MFEYDINKVITTHGNKNNYSLIDIESGLVLFTISSDNFKTHSILPFPGYSDDKPYLLSKQEDGLYVINVNTKTKEKIHSMKALNAGHPQRMVFLQDTIHIITEEEKILTMLQLNLF